MNRNPDREGAKTSSGQATYLADDYDIRLVSEFEEWVGETGDIELTERFVSCVNALAGIQNPAAIKQLIDAAHRLLLAFQNPDFRELSAALAALDQTVSEAQQTPAESGRKPKVT